MGWRLNVSNPFYSNLVHYVLEMNVSEDKDRFGGKGCCHGDDKLTKLTPSRKQY